MTFLKELEECLMSVTCVRKKEAKPQYLNIQKYFGILPLGLVEIPKIKVSISIYGDTSEKKLQKGAGHLEGSSIPVGGKSTHALISAHRGLVQKKMFTNLDQMEKGDLFLLHILDDTLCYLVRDIRVVKPHQVESLQIQKGEDLVTFITCTPYGLNTHRLLVEGERYSYKKEK